MRCTESGCTGTYVDGYCDFCGAPQQRSEFPVGSSATPPASSAAAPPAPSTGTETAAPASPTGTSVAVATPPPAAAAPGTSTTWGGSILIGSARGTKATRRFGTTMRSRASSLGAGLTTVPSVPVSDPAAAVLASPMIPEEKRNCSYCGAPVGRAHSGRPGREEGFCPQCRRPFSFRPKLSRGDLVAGQYEVEGCLAHGGLGWIYLARDRNVSDRWVVLKGLLNAGDPDALAAAIAEQEFLAAVSHPLIVEIYNFVTHDDAGYIVMEYVGGTSLKELLKQRMSSAGRYDPFPVEQALAYVLEILPAFQYLHDRNLLYCDFKPDNLIQTGDEVRLIDMGGVRRIDDLDSPIYGTIGYQAPEIAQTGPSVASDIYTIGRTLTVLTTEFRGYQTTYATSLPPMQQVPAFVDYPAFYQLVAKACALDPDDRFTSVEELRVQLDGVLRRVVRDRRGSPAASQTHASLFFEAPVTQNENFAWWELPALLPDGDDPMTGWLQTVQSQEPVTRYEQLAKAPTMSSEVLLEQARTGIRGQRHDLVARATDMLLAADPWDWRAVWLIGLDALSRHELAQARAAFGSVAAQVPGELAPVLAGALAAELDGQDSSAESAYLTCLRTDSAYVPVSAFGLARMRAGSDDLRGAITVLEQVPASNRAHPRALWLRAQMLARAGEQGVHSLSEAMDTMVLAAPDRVELTTFRIDVLEMALEIVRRSGAQPDVQIDGVPAKVVDLRRALERNLRDLAQFTPDEKTRIALVDRANSIRPWSLR
ncbi:serine/threonine-protein kinase [Austwickia chelonae]|uniref:non-specific serine/threonine protein kinase n=1 Tax=Austwickia chelonae NBRC 105200 TaxID=1184607 RepID=K6VPH8_9MICO|nr:serine/threonine-protein kinase [Austwickia chelonae]GAB78629.1 putative serine/threonine protein kinase [Austwickia chelonae NBRC 105200]